MGMPQDGYLLSGLQSCTIYSTGPAYNSLHMLCACRDRSEVLHIFFFRATIIGLGRI